MQSPTMVLMFSNEPERERRAGRAAQGGRPGSGSPRVSIAEGGCACGTPLVDVGESTALTFARQKLGVERLPLRVRLFALAAAASIVRCRQ